MNPMLQFVFAASIPLILQLLGLTLAVWADPYIQKRQRKIMFVIIALILSLIIRDLIETQLDLDGTLHMARTIAAMYGYIIRPLVIVLFFYIVESGRRHSLIWWLLALNTLIYLTPLFSPICFRISSNDHFQRGPLGYTCHIVSAIALLELLFLTFRAAKGMRKAHILIPLFNVLLIVLSVLLDSFILHTQTMMSLLTLAMASSCLFYYIWLHLQFVRAHEQALMAEQRIKIMMSQIQPHFLYNTLSTIQALCRTDPQKAFEVTERFGSYLRQNIDSLSQPEQIPIQQELAHTRIYTEIEEIRFPNVHVEYDAQDLDFSLPALTVQPLVENAVRHGVRIRENGVVRVTTRRENGFHEIVIRDNGKGLDPMIAERADGTHIGIRNVRERIEQMCGGTLEIRSVNDEGTLVTIRIPA